MGVLGLDEVGSDGLHSSQEDGDPGVCTNVGVNSFFFSWTGLLLLWRIIFVPGVRVREGMGKCGLQAFGD